MPSLKDVIKVTAVREKWGNEKVHNAVHRILEANGVSHSGKHIVGSGGDTYVPLHVNSYSGNGKKPHEIEEHLKKLGFTHAHTADNKKNVKAHVWTHPAGNTVVLHSGNDHEELHSIVHHHMAPEK